MRIAILGSGAVGGYYGARLARAGHDVTFIARGPHLHAIRDRGLQIRSPMLGDFTIRAPAEEDTAKVGVVDVVLYAVKAYDNPTALSLVKPMIGPSSTVLTVQNGVDSVSELAAVVGEAGGRWRSHLHRHHALGAGRDRADRNAPARRLWRSIRGAAARQRARQSAARSTGRCRHPLGAGGRRSSTRSGRSSFFWWRSPDSRADRGCHSAPSGAIRSSARSFSPAAGKSRRLARAEGIPVATDVIDRISAYADGIPGTMRSSLLIDLSAGKRTEVEALHGSVVRRAERAGVAVPIISTLYALLKPWAHPRA